MRDWCWPSCCRRRRFSASGGWIGGVRTRRVDDLVQAMGLSGISKSQVSKLCKEIDERVHAFLDLRMISSSVQSLMPYSLLDVILRATAAPQGPSVDEIVPVLAVRR